MAAAAAAPPSRTQHGCDAAAASVCLCHNAAAARRARSPVPRDLIGSQAAFRGFSGGRNPKRGRRRRRPIADHGAVSWRRRAGATAAAALAWLARQRSCGKQVQVGHRIGSGEACYGAASCAFARRLPPGGRWHFISIPESGPETIKYLESAARRRARCQGAVR